ncbi:DUF943 family protein [Kalamiella sp. sgz302252]|uniref:DUF943 family protein n=1 Tax=Pantoea sp. sgz302252 TaxID=3341827 RepID=UPI0036D2DB40
MKAKSLKIITLLAILIISISFFYKKETKIVMVDGNAIYVKNFPDSDKQQIRWWHDNRNSIKNEFNLPKNSKDFVLLIMDFGKGYEKKPEEGWTSFDKSPEDFTCFANIKPPKNCIYNNQIMMLMGNSRGYISIAAAKNQYLEAPDGTVQIIRKE